MHGRTNAEQGSALLIVMVIATIGAIVSMVSLRAIRHTAQTTGVVRVKSSLLHMAEAGKEHAISELRAGTVTPVADQVTQIIEATSFKGGSYQVICKANADISRVVLISTATIGTSTKSIEVECTIVEAEGISVDQAILCGGTFDFKGCGSISSADGSRAALHANGLLDISGNAGMALDITSATRIRVGNNTVQGSIAAPLLTLHSHALITGGATTKSVQAVVIPSPDMQPWHDEAGKNGEIHNGFHRNGSYTATGEVIWVNGNVSLSGGPGTTIRGSIIATGDISVSGAVDIVAPENGIALATRDGSIKVSTSGTIHGLVYVRSGNYSQTANGRLEGQLIVKGNITKGGNSDIVVCHKSTVVPPGVGRSVEVVTWRELN